ncbi:MAG TPA: hypothetical protein ENN31_00425 [Candidatus Vogelbacteria bacterium]|nr:hypothetical protein [Candidatus Vogelbacteria bacterium]
MIDVKIEKTPNSSVAIKGELAEKEFSSYRSKALEVLKSEIKIDGFRPGHAPLEMVANKAGEEKVLFTMADLAIKDIYPTIIKDNKIDAIGRPNITITKLAFGNPLGFTIITAITPEFTLPKNYLEISKKEIAKIEKPAEIIEEDVLKAIATARQQKKMSQEKDIPEKDKKTDLSPLNDSVAQEFGFKDLIEMKQKVKENMTQIEKNKYLDKKKSAVIKKLANQTNIDLPLILIESELEKMLNELKGQIEASGLKFEDYLNHLKKSEEELKETWKPDAIIRIKAALIIEKIAEQEQIKAEPDEIDKEVNRLAKYYNQEFDEITKKQLSKMTTRAIINEKTLELLIKE